MEHQRSRPGRRRLGLVRAPARRQPRAHVLSLEEARRLADPLSGGTLVDASGASRRLGPGDVHIEPRLQVELQVEKPPFRGDLPVVVPPTCPERGARLPHRSYLPDQGAPSHLPLLGRGRPGNSRRRGRRGRGARLRRADWLRRSRALAGAPVVARTMRVPLALGHFLVHSRAIMPLFPEPTSGDPITMTSGKLEVPTQPIIPFIEGDGTGPGHLARQPARARRRGREGLRRQDARSPGTRSTPARRRSPRFNDLAPRRDGRGLPQVPGRASKARSRRRSARASARSTSRCARCSTSTCACGRCAGSRACPRRCRIPSQVDMVIFRENTEDIYAGIEWEAESDEAKKVIAFLENEMKVKKIRFPEDERHRHQAHVARGHRAAGARGDRVRARATKRKSVTLVHKGNIMKFTEGAFRDWGYARRHARVPRPGRDRARELDPRQQREEPVAHASRPTRKRDRARLRHGAARHAGRVPAGGRGGARALGDARRRQVEEDAARQGLASPTSRCSRCSRARRSSTSSPR